MLQIHKSRFKKSFEGHMGVIEANGVDLAVALVFAYFDKETEYINKNYNNVHRSDRM